MNFLYRNARWITLAPVVLILLMIFFFSAQDAERSSRTSGRVVDAVIRVSVPKYSTYSRKKQISVRERISYRVRKAAHFTEFALLGFFLLIHLLAVDRRGLPLRALLAWALGVVFAGLDEVHQLFSQGRAGRVFDVMIDSSGVLFGVVLAVFLWRLFLTLRNRRQGKS